MNNNLFPGVDDRLVSQCNGCKAFFTKEHLSPLPGSDPTTRRRGVSPSGSCPRCQTLAYPIVTDTIEIPA